MTIYNQTEPRPVDNRSTVERIKNRIGQVSVPTMATIERAVALGVGCAYIINCVIRIKNNVTK